MKSQENKWDVIDECGRLIESNISLKRARDTKKLNPGSQITFRYIEGGGNDENIRNANGIGTPI